MSDEAAPTPAAINSPFAVPLFRAMWPALMISNLGVMIQTVGASWLMTSLSDSSVMVALVQASASLPIMLFGLLAGAIADNLDRRRVMLTAQIFMLVATAILAFLAFTGWITPFLLLGFTFVIACGTALNWPAMQVSVAEIVPRAVMPKAVAANAMGVNISRSVGPAFGGAIIAAFGAAAAFFLNALSYVGLIAVLARWKYKAPERLLPPEKLGPAMAAGLRYAALSPVMSAVLVRALCYGIVASAVQSLMPLIARDLVNGNALTFGFLLGAFGMGAVGGAMSSSRLRAKWSTEAIVRNGCIVAALASVLAGFSGTMWLTMPAMAMAGASWLMTLSTFNVTIQLSSPRWVVARGLSLYQTGAFGGIAIGSWIFGSIAQWQGTATALFAAGAGMVAVALIGVFLPIVVRSEADLGPRSDWEIPETEVPINLRSGPIVVAIEYRVRADDVLRFSALMQERARILRRDGARRWSLGRDLGDEELWLERYYLPTWFDYVLLNQRRTKDDLMNQVALVDTLIEGTSPVIHRFMQRQWGALPWSRPFDSTLIEPSSRNG